VLNALLLIYVNVASRAERIFSLDFRGIMLCCRVERIMPPVVNSKQQTPCLCKSSVYESNVIM
jgi:hypothetical protein